MGCMEVWGWKLCENLALTHGAIFGHSGINTYVRNARKMRDIGETELARALKVEIAGEGGELQQQQQQQQQQTTEESAEQWTRYYSEEHSRHYLHNEKTGETRWE